MILRRTQREMLGIGVWFDSNTVSSHRMCFLTLVGFLLALQPSSLTTYEMDGFERAAQVIIMTAMELLGLRTG